MFAYYPVFLLSRLLKKPLSQIAGQLAKPGVPEVFHLSNGATQSIINLQIFFTCLINKERNI
ncbi:hypothetical protein BHG07_12995 [Brenneria salicis ATCC 15712 = DSM 30166]|nr:hypothetical protein BHG07_12995 [Brenneria salicis ATCC 15712 = DSM 30166]